MLYKWKCLKCDWQGDNPESTKAHVFLGTEEEETEEDYTETCPKCGEKQQAVYNNIS